MNKSKKTWKNIKPHSSKSRKNMKLKHGNKCFFRTAKNEISNM